MQIDPDEIDFFTNSGGVGDPNYSVALILTVTGATLLGKVVFDRTSAPDEATPFGRDTDSWTWSTTGSEWPSEFRLRIGSSPPFEATAGDYATWPNSAFASTTVAPPTTSRYRIHRIDADNSETLMGELLVAVEGAEYRLTWWTQGSVLRNQRIPMVANTDYRFATVTGATALDTSDLYAIEHDPVAIRSVTIG